MSTGGLAAFIKAVSESRIDPPEGYDYKRNSDGSVLLDENGYPVLHKRGEPFFSVIWNPTGFRPTPEQYAKYKALLKRYKEAGLASSPEEDKLGEQLLEMRRVHVGPVPDAIGSSWAVPGDTEWIPIVVMARGFLTDALQRIHGYPTVGWTHVLTRSRLSRAVSGVSKMLAFVSLAGAMVFKGVGVLEQISVVLAMAAVGVCLLRGNIDSDRNYKHIASLEQERCLRQVAPTED